MKITDEAKSFIQGVLEQNNAKGIKVIFAGMGWGGPKLGLSLDEATDQDIVETINGVQVAFEKSIKEQTESLTLDFQETPQGSGLVMVGINECC
jgi:Fe-S cluster assembly iron-binding protein IscA